MSAEGNKAILRDSYEAIFNQHEVHRANEFYAASYLDPGVLPSTGGLEGTKHNWSSAIGGFPDLRATIVEMIAEADKVAVAWMLEGTHQEELAGAPATGQPIRLSGLALYRLTAGRITELVAGTSPMSSLRVALPSVVSADRSTERSRALLEEVIRLIPEIDDLDRPRLFNFEFAHGPERRQVTAGAERTYPGLGQITVHIAVSSPGEWRVPCTPGSSGQPCTRIEKLPDGSTAYLHTYTVPGTIGHGYDVTLVKPDGTGVSVSSAAYRPDHADMPDAPLSLDRVWRSLDRSLSPPERTRGSRGRIGVVRELGVHQLSAVGLAAVGGVGLAVQARLNGGLGASLGDGVVASMISTGSGIFVLLVIVPGSRVGRRALGQIREALRVHGLRWWQCLGGVAGALYVASQGISVGSLGVGVFTVAVVGGTSAGSLAVDRAGLGPGGIRAITTPRLIGAVAGVIAVAIAGHASLSDGSLALLALPLIAGLGLSIQSALNGRVSAVAGSPWAAALVNFVVAMCTLCIALPIEFLLRGKTPGSLPTEPWLYCGGFVGVGIIAIAASVVRHLGVLVFGLTSITGQLLGAVLLDTFGAHRPPTTTWIAIAITLGAVAITVIRPQRAS